LCSTCAGGEDRPVWGECNKAYEDGYRAGRADAGVKLDKLIAGGHVLHRWDCRTVSWVDAPERGFRYTGAPCNCGLEELLR